MDKSNQSVETINPKESEIVEDSQDKKTNSTATFNQQNNFHLTLNIDIDKLSVLSEKAPNIADRVVSIYEKQLEQNINADNKVLDLEENEQKLRITEKPYQRKYAFTSLYFAMGLSVLSLCFAGFFAYKEYPYLAAISITIPITVAVANMLGFKTAKSNLPKKKKKEEQV